MNLERILGSSFGCSTDLVADPYITNDNIHDSSNIDKMKEIDNANININNNNNDDDFYLFMLLRSLPVEDVNEASLSPPLSNIGNNGVNYINAFSDSENSDTGDLGANNLCKARLSNDTSYSSVSSVNSNHSNNSQNGNCAYGQGMKTLSSSPTSNRSESGNTWRYSPCSPTAEQGSPSPGMRSPQGLGSPMVGQRSPASETRSSQGLDSPMVGQRSSPVSGSPREISSPISSPTKTLDGIWRNSGLCYGNDRRHNVPVCTKHRERIMDYCETCSELLCPKCFYEAHLKHKYKPYHLIIETESRRCLELTQSVIATKCYLLSKEDDVNATIASLEKMKDNAHRKLRSHVRDLIDKICEHEKDIKKKIDEAYQSKVEQLRARSATLGMQTSRLSFISSNLIQAVNDTTKFVNPLTLSHVQDFYLYELYAIRTEVLNTKETPSEYWIDFQPSDVSQIFKPYGELGVVSTKSYGVVGDQREAKAHYNETLRQLIERAPVMPRARGQVVPGSHNEVIARLPDGSKSPLPILEIGNNVPEEHRFCRPWGVACDPEGRIFVADRSNNRILVYSSEGRLINQWGSHGSGIGQFDRPAGIAVDARKRVVVVDKDNHRIQVMTTEGRHLFMFGQKGSQPGHFNYPWDVAVNSECQIVVTDTRNHRIQQFSANGAFLRRFGFENTPLAWKSFDSPRGVTFDPQGDIVMTDFNTHRVVKIDQEFATYVYLSNQDVPVTFSRPQGLLVDDAGNFVIADSKNCQILVYNWRGRLINKIGVPGQNSGELDRPSGMALTPEGRLVVVDFGNNRVVVF